MPPTTKSKSLARARAVRRGRPKGSKNLKKTTKRGAYKGARKRNFQIRRAPFVETKRRVHSEVAISNSGTDGTPSANYQQPINGLNIPNNDAFTLLDLASYYRNSHGFEDHNVLGDALYSKYLKLKTQIRWPAGTNMIVNPVKVYLITGWVTQPAGFTNNTTPTDQAATAVDLRAHISDQLKEYFDSRSDFLKFAEKQTSNVKIEKWISIKPDNNAAIAAQPGQIDVETDPTKPAVIRTTGAVPIVNRSFTWKTMRKVHLTSGTSLPTNTNAPNPDIQNLYPNHNNWLPFAIIYNPDYASMRNANNDDVEMTIFYNDIHYYTDS